jgi:hypothetical protein
MREWNHYQEQSMWSWFSDGHCSRAWERVKVGNTIFIPYYRKCIYADILLDPALCHESVQEFQGAVDMSSDKMQGLTLVTEKLAYL